MLILKNVTKDYVTGNETVRAMNEISINFRENEFVSILGSSGCGKTTMLNVISGLDRYDSGDLIIDGKSTKDFTEEDWDNYRNHSIGFIFQSHNLIPHLTVLENVELALTISGISKEERREKAIEALKKVGMDDQLHKKPNQISGGQAQRVSIARSIVKEDYGCKYIICDEPVSSLDSFRSEEILEILKGLTKDPKHPKTVIMVTHDANDALKYSDRIISCKDGQIVDDTNPFEPTEKDFKKEKKSAEKEKKTEKPSMSFATAFGLSLRNLWTKKGKTLVTAFASSLGIIAIALILSLSSGIQNYIDKIENDALLVFPVSVEKQSVNSDDLISSISGLASSDAAVHEKDKVYVNEMMTNLVNSFIANSTSNNLKAFKKYIDDNEVKFNEICNDIQFKYSVPLNIYRTDTENGPIKVNPSTLMDSFQTNDMMSSMQDMMGGMMDFWKELIGDEDVLSQQYDVIYGRLPKEKNEVILMVDKNNEINEFLLYALGLRDQSEFSKNLMNSLSGEEFETTDIDAFNYEDICNMKFKLVFNHQYMVKDKKTGLWSDRSNNTAYVEKILENAMELKIVGIVRPNEYNIMTSTANGIGYLSSLMDYAIAETEKSEVVQEQLNNPKKDVITGLEFTNLTVNDFDLADVDLSQLNMKYLDFSKFTNLIPEDLDLSQIDIMNIDFSSFIDFGDMSDLTKKIMEGFMSEDQVIALKQCYLDSVNAICSYDKTMSTLGYQPKDTPTSIYFYPKSFDDKEELNNMVNYYNEQVEKEGHPEYAITPTDGIGVIFNTVSSITAVISWVLIFFTSICLVTSSFLVALVVYAEVSERIREIGVLRALGSSQKDIARIFNVETITIGLLSGILGILTSLILHIPINFLIDLVTHTGAEAHLSLSAALILIVLSTFVNLIAGLVPSGIAARKDPVDALRAE